MLARCARSIETGYTTFTTRLCWGENLGFCPRTRLSLIWLARRGFGLRILPSYMKCLVEGIIETENDTCTRNTPSQKAQPSISQAYLNKCSLHKISELGVNVAAVQPFSGLKTLKRYIMLGRKRLPTVLRETTVEESSDHRTSHQILALESLSWLLELDIALRSNPIGAARVGIKELYTHRISRPLLTYETLSYDNNRAPDFWDLFVDIDEFNQNLFLRLQRVVCWRLQIPFQLFGCK